MDLRDIVRLAIEEDVGSGDITTDAFSSHARQGVGQLKAKESCVVFGMEVVKEVFAQIDSSLKVDSRIHDGQRAKGGDVIATIDGPMASILKGERLALNFIQRLSGIATMTSRFADLLEHAHVYDTRKTTPLLRTLEKQAVLSGGGRNHRMGLYDAILLKDNHVALAGSVAQALRMAREKHPVLSREIEVGNEAQLCEALAEKAEILLLDNMTPDQVRSCLALIKESGYEPEVEVSGNVTLENVKGYDLPGVQRISVGGLTNNVRTIDMNLKIAPR